MLGTEPAMLLRPGMALATDPAPSSVNSGRGSLGRKGWLEARQGPERMGGWMNHFTLLPAVCCE